MAFENKLDTVSLEAAGDFSAFQYRFMAVTGSGQFAPTSAGAQVDGVLQDKPTAAGQSGAIGISGISKVQLGGTVSNGALMASGSNGEGAAAGSGDNVAGKALEAGVSGDIISVLLKTQNANPLP